MGPGPIASPTTCACSLCRLPHTVFAAASRAPVISRMSLRVAWESGEGEDAPQMAWLALQPPLRQPQAHGSIVAIRSCTSSVAPACCFVWRNVSFATLALAAAVFTAADCRAAVRRAQSWWPTPSMSRRTGAQCEVLRPNGGRQVVLRELLRTRRRPSMVRSLGPIAPRDSEPGAV